MHQWFTIPSRLFPLPADKPHQLSNQNTVFGRWDLENEDVRKDFYKDGFFPATHQSTIFDNWQMQTFSPLT